MRYSYLTLLLAVLYVSCQPKDKTNYLSVQKTVMAPPILASENVFFTDSILVTMKFSLPGAEIKYTVDGTAVTLESTTYDSPVIAHKSTTLTAKNFHPEFQSGCSATLKVIRTNSTLEESTIMLSPSPNERYKANGNSSLIDHKKGALSFANGTEWLGFQADTIGISVTLTEAKPIKKVLVSTLTNHGAWIFLPHSISVFSNDLEIGKTEINAPAETDVSGLEFIAIAIEENTYDQLKIVITSLAEIPEWHQGKGTLPWFFIDELLVE